MSHPNQPHSFPRMVGRALLRRCPWCGGKGAWFRTWFRRHDRCKTCGLKWNRGQDGFELGAMTVAAVLTGGGVMLFLAVMIIFTYPDFAVFPMTIGGVGIAVLMPVVAYPLTQTLWSAFDVRVHPPMPEEFTDSTPAEFLPTAPTVARRNDVSATSMWATPSNGDASANEDDSRS